MAVIIDPQNAGIAGNMILGAFIDLGVDFQEMKEFVEKIAIDFGDFEINNSKINKNGIESTYIKVKINNNHQKSIQFQELLNKLENIEKLLEKDDSFDKKFIKAVFDISKKVFNRIAISEAKIHGKNLDEVHFHEVGFVDAIVDVFGSVYCYCKLGLNHSNELVIGLPIALGGGTTNTSHGRIPIPSPVVIDMLKGVNCFGGPVAIELATPTGVGLYLELCDDFMDFQPMMKIEDFAYGAGKKNLDFPNVLRLIQGKIIGEKQQIQVLETNIDHLSGEVIGYLFEKLLSLGARDVAIIPIIMKKNRPGYLLKVISKKEDSEKLISAIFKETETLGIRISEHTHRGIANREFIFLETNIHGKKEGINFKIGLIGDEIISSKPEYDDLKEIAKKRNISLTEVSKIANQKIKNYLDKNNQ